MEAIESEGASWDFDSREASPFLADPESLLDLPPPRDRETPVGLGMPGPVGCKPWSSSASEDQSHTTGACSLAMTLMSICDAGPAQGSSRGCGPAPVPAAPLGPGCPAMLGSAVLDDCSMPGSPDVELEVTSHSDAHRAANRSFRSLVDSPDHRAQSRRRRSC